MGIRVGIVTTWFERGAAYVSRQFRGVLNSQFEVFIYARGGENKGKGDPYWDLPGVHWAKEKYSPFLVTVFDKRDFISWLKGNKIDVVLFNEQHWWPPILWCKKLGIKTIAYIDYYKKSTIPVFEVYDTIICNTLRHLEAFNSHRNVYYLPWGTDIELFKPTNKIFGKTQKRNITFFHSCGMDPYRKGTDLVIKAFSNLKNDVNSFLIIHTQRELTTIFPDLEGVMQTLIDQNRIEIITKSVPAPGLFHTGDVYVYPTRLEGIGLTIIEALASGLPCLVPDNGPMNEFVDEECGSLIKVKKFYCRDDGYYWPECEIDLNDLTEVMEKYIKDERISMYKGLNARDKAVKNFNWSYNSKCIGDIIRQTFDNRDTEIDYEKVRSIINRYEYNGKRRIINLLNNVPFISRIFFRFISS